MNVYISSTHCGAGCGIGLNVVGRSAVAATADAYGLFSVDVDGGNTGNTFKVQNNGSVGIGCTAPNASYGLTMGKANIHMKSDSEIKLSDPQSPQWEGIYLSPIHPEVNPYLLTLYNEIITNYDIDGIHLDYIRFQDEVYGYNKSGMAVFENLYNIHPRDIVRGIVSTHYGWSQEFVDSMYVAWNNFRSNAVSDLVNGVSSKIQQSKKHIVLSAAVKPNLLEARDRWYQDWGKWIQEGMINFVVPMNYFPAIRDYNNSIQIMKANLRPQDIEFIIMGISTYNQDSQSAADKILLARLNGFNGISIFSYDSHKNNLEWFRPITKTFGTNSLD